MISSEKLSIVLFVLVMVYCGAARAQCEAGFMAGLTVPGTSSDNAPQLRRGFVGGLTVSWQLPQVEWKVSQWCLRVDFRGLRQWRFDSPDTAAVPLDGALHVVSYQHLPLTFGMECRRAIGMQWRVSAVCGLGGYFRHHNCQRLLSSTWIRGYNDSGIGFALLAGVEAVYASTWVVAAEVSAVGNPFEHVGPSLAEEKGSALHYINRDLTLSGYRQFFVLLGVGYRIEFSKK